MGTVAVYELTENGRIRLGTFRHSGASIREVSQQYAKRYPQADLTRIGFAPRVKLFGRFQDGDVLPAEPSPES